jgi:RNA polymerase sigma-70 factor (ECF subfamily)
MNPKKLQDSFVELIATQQKLIHSICGMYYSSTEDRKDIFQEIVLQLWKSYPAFKFMAKPSTWIYRVALNTIFSKLRKDKSRRLDVSLSDDLLYLPAEEPTDTDSRIESLHQAICQLSDIDKAIILLYLEECSYEEIAEILKLTKTNVSTRIHRIKTRLEKLMKLYTV